MKLRSIAVLAAFASACLSLCQAPSVSALQGAFVENRGQWDTRAQFLSQSPGLNTWITADGVVYDFHSFTRTNPVDPSPKLDRAQGLLKGQVVHVTFENSYGMHASGSTIQQGVFNYLGNHPTIKSVRRYSEANSGEIYPGISARYYYDNGSPRYDLIVNPGADPNQISMRFEGASNVSIRPNGNLEMKTVLGPIEETGLTVYQGDGSTRKTIPAKMVLDDNVVHFKMGSYDRSQKLTIDPVLYSSYIGGNGGSYLGDRVNAVANWVSFEGDIRQTLVGNTGSTNFPTTTGAYQTVLQAGDEGFVAEMDWTTGSLLWCSFFQGATTNSSAFLEPLTAVANFYGIYIAGAVENEDFPTTAGVFQTTNSNPAVLAGFVAEISSDGTTLEASSFLSGSTAGTIITGSAFDSVGNLMLTGRTFATDFPVTAGAYQSTNHGAVHGYSNAFATKISPDLKTLVASTYFGGSGGEIGYAVAPTIYGDTNDEFVIAGNTSSTDLPVSGGCWQPTNKTKGGTTGFVTTLTADATGLLFSSYYGGSVNDNIYSLYVDANQNIFFGGATKSPDLPAESGILGKQNGFVGCLYAEEDHIGGCAYIGGSNYDQVLSIAPGYAGNGIYVAGITYSTDFPVTAQCYQPGISGESSGFVSLYPAVGSLPTYATYYGSNTGVLAMSTDLYGYPIIGGTAGTVPVTPGAIQTTNQDTTNAQTGFFARISPAAETLGLTFEYLNSSVGGGLLPVTVSLSSIAPETGATVTLASDNPDVTLPVSSVFIPANSSTYNVNMSSKIVSSAVTIHITASYNGEQVVGAFRLIPHSISLLSLPTTVMGGNSFTGTVTLSGTAGATNMILPLSSSNTAAVQVPASMTILAGKGSGTFVATTSPVNAATVVTVKVSNDDNYRTATITVEPPLISTITASPTPVAGGTTSTGTLTLSGKAGPAGAVVPLKNLNPSLITIPTSVKVLGGALSVAFPIETVAVDKNSPAGIEGTLNSVSADGYLTIAPAAISSVKLSPSTVVGGAPDTGTVALASPAGPSGVVATLSTYSSQLAQVAASVKVAPGAKTATFTITTTQVLSNSSDTIYAKVGAYTDSAILTLVPIQLSSISVVPPTVVGGTKTQATITITGGITSTTVFVNVASSVPAAAKPEVAQLAFGTKGVTSMTDAIDTFPVNAAATVTLTASYNGISKTAILNVNPDSLTSFAISPLTVVGGAWSVGKVTLTGPSGSAATIALSSDTPSVAKPQAASVVIAAQTASASFNALTYPVNVVSTAKISATYLGVTKTATITVNPPPLISIVASPTTITAGQSVSLTISLSGYAASAGVVVSLQSSTLAITVPATVKIPAGKSSVQVALASQSVGSSTVQAVITAKLGTTTKTAAVNVNPVGG